ncbi:polysaccharide deacetylase family protein [bacterium]|nr:polysaccharide deacetylase family protein [bacterium]
MSSNSSINTTLIVCGLLGVAGFCRSAFSAEKICEGQHVVLTFDDGPHNNNTPPILRALHDAGEDGESIPATFYIVGKAIGTATYRKNNLNLGGQSGEEIISAIEKNPNWLIANHTKTHPDLAKLSRSDLEKEIEYFINEPKVSKAKESQNHFATFRAPFGSKNQMVLDRLAAHGYDHEMSWDLDSLDWAIDSGSAGYTELKGASPEKKKEVLLQRIKDRLKDLCEQRKGARDEPIVVLFHDIKATTGAALPEILDYMKSVGVEFKGLNEVEKYSQAWVPTHAGSPARPPITVKPKFRIETKNGRTTIEPANQEH